MQYASDQTLTPVSPQPKRTLKIPERSIVIGPMSSVLPGGSHNATPTMSSSDSWLFRSSCCESSGSPFYPRPHLARAE